MTTKTCSYQKCGRPAAIRGLCRGHDRMKRLHPGEELRPLRGKRGALFAGERTSRVTISLRDSTAREVRRDVQGARAALDTFAEGKKARK